jgi:hypothetical protein
MIERQTINGRPATVAYMSAAFEPVDAQAAELAQLPLFARQIPFKSNR